jgi:hypothetical protein
VPNFDPRAYEDQVLKPLRKRLPHLPDDLLTRYAVDLTMDSATLRGRIDSVVRLWNKAAMKAGPTGLVCQQLLREHHELQRSGSADLTSPHWWQAREAVRHQRLGPDVEDLAAVLESSHGALGVITHNQLRAAAAAHPTLGNAEIDQARTIAGLDIVEPVELPTAAGIRGRLDSLTTKLIAAGVDSIPRLLFPDLSTFGLLGGFTVSPLPTDRDAALSRQVAEKRAADLDKAPDSPSTRASREAVGILISEASGGADLAALALFHVLQEVRDKRADGAQPRTLFSLLTRSGLHGADAARIVVSVLAESGVRRDPLAAVAHLLAGGKLVAAQQLATTLAGPPGDTARQAVQRHRDQVDSLRRAAADELRAGRDEQARARLAEALRLACDLPELAAQLAKVPAAPVVAVTAHADGCGVRIAWRPAPDHGDATTFQVVRRQGRDPASPDDGYQIPVRSTSGYSVNGYSTNDEAPPVGQPVHYAVFARCGSPPAGQWSRAACAATQIVPPVADVVIQGGSNVVTARWGVHPDVAAVEVHRTAGVVGGQGEPVAVDGNRAFCDETAVDGVAYFYTLVACYPHPSGTGTLRSAPVVVRGATRPQARPVTALTATPAVSEELTVTLSWSQQPGSQTVIRSSPQPCPWEYGQVVASAELAGYGVELDGTRTAKGESMTLVAAVPPGRSYCVPFTLGAQGAVRGQAAVVALVPPVRRLRAQRFADDVRVTWLWPDKVSAAQVQWAGGQRRITTQQYREEGGCQLRGCPGISRIEVSAVMVGEREETRSSVASVVVEERPPQLSYRLRRRGYRLTGGVMCVVTLCGAVPVTGATVIIVAAAGHAMPLSPEAGVELLRQPVVVEPAVPVVLEAPLPRLPKPYWLRCFLAEPAPALLIDPPVDQLKVC